MRLKLEHRTWEIGRPLDGDRAGFGKVFEATSEDGRPVVAKFVHKEPGAEREMLFGDALAAAELANVVPILDRGGTDDSWVLIMPRAERSLAQHLATLNGELMDPAAVVDVLKDVAVALVALTGAEIVHRDLKPQNVLLLDGRWCLADFGISRYAQAATEPETRKHFMTPQYAAPEQWRSERATSATDVYAFGAMAYELLAGKLPFAGPGVHDLREQHLTTTPPRLSGGTARMRNIVEECLAKEPVARPTPANLLMRLEKASLEPKSAAGSRLALQNLRITRERTQAAVEAEAVRQESERLARLAEDGIRAFDAFVDPLLQAIEDDAPTTTIERGAGHGTMIFVARLGGARIGVSAPVTSADWSGPFSVVANARIVAGYNRHNRSGWEARSHSLWYCDPFEQSQFGWYELAFMDFALSGSSPAIYPYALEPPEASGPFSGVTGMTQLAWPLEELDRDDPDEFVERWLGWFADAVEGTLNRPSQMPERHDEGRWRRN